MESDVLIVSALLRREGHVLLMLGTPSGGSPSAWGLPAGVMEPYEHLLEALARVVRDRAGLEVLRVGNLVHVAQSSVLIDRERPEGNAASSPARSTIFTIEVAEWRGTIAPAEPSGLGPRFWPREDAIGHLQRHPWPPAAEGAAAYLRGEQREQLWLYRGAGGENDSRVWPAQPPSLTENEDVRKARALIALGCIVALALLVLIVVIGIITLARPFL